jgi:hypothetical protein
MQDAASPQSLCDLLIDILENEKPYRSHFTRSDHSEEADVLDVDVDYGVDQEAISRYKPFLLVDKILGIPKKALIKAYVKARVEFFAILSKLPGTLRDNATIDIAIGARLQCLTKVMLCFDSEHLTAANTR